MATARLDVAAVILLVAWIVGLASSYTMGGLIHLLLFVAIGLVGLRVLRGQRTT